MKDPVFNNLLAHWHALRAHSDVPNRAEIDPRVFPEALENIFISEMINPDEYRIRLAGLEICQMIGLEVRGQPVLSLMQDSAREKMGLILSQVLNRPAIAEIRIEAVDLNDRASAMELLLLPLRSDLGDVSRMIGCFSTPAPSLLSPVKLRIRSQKIIPVAGLDEQGGQSGLAETQAAFGTDGPKAIYSNPDITPRKRGKRNHLRIVGGKDQET